MKNQIELITVEQIILINKLIVNQNNQEHCCLQIEKIDSALAAAFYPGDYPFNYGGIAKVAGALCYFLTKAHAFLDGNKRTAGIAAITFMEINGYELIYPVNPKTGLNKFAEVLERAADNTVSKDELILWFDRHKYLKNKRI